MEPSKSPVHDPPAALPARPKKGILKNSSSFDKPSHVPAAVPGHKETKWDEMNILATHHPADKDYGHMKVMEPKTPYSYYNEMNEEVEGEGGEPSSVDPTALAEQIGVAAGSPRRAPRNSESGTESGPDEEETGEERARRLSFEAKRKAHYKEYYAVKLSRKLMEDDEDEEEGKEKDADKDKEKDKPKETGEPSGDPDALS